MLATAAAGADARRRTVDAAHATVLTHVRGEGGWCSECMDRACPARVPCPLARCALSIIETHGVTGWDTPRPGVA